jgi:hypothetical protein
MENNNVRIKSLTLLGRDRAGLQVSSLFDRSQYFRTSHIINAVIISLFFKYDEFDLFKPKQANTHAYKTCWLCAVGFWCVAGLKILIRALLLVQLSNSLPLFAATKNPGLTNFLTIQKKIAAAHRG